MDFQNPRGERVASAAGDAAGGFLAGTRNYGVSGIVRNGAGDYTVTHVDMGAALNGKRKAIAFGGGGFKGVASAAPISATRTDVFGWDLAGIAQDCAFIFEIDLDTDGND